MPEDLKLSQISSSQLPPPFRGLHSPGVRKHCQITFACYFRKSSITNRGNRLTGPVVRPEYGMMGINELMCCERAVGVLLIVVVTVLLLPVLLPTCFVGVLLVFFSSSLYFCCCRCRCHRDWQCWGWCCCCCCAVVTANCYCCGC